MTTEIETQNLAIARIFIEQFLGRGDMSVAEHVLDENVQAITGLKPDGPINGREEYKHVFSAFFDAFPPASELVIDEMFAAGDRVVVRFQSPQKHTKDFFGIPATYRTINLIEAHIMRLRDGKIVENIVSATNLEFEMLMAPVLIPLILK
jgi:predicted ester cyclase